MSFLAFSNLVPNIIRNANCVSFSYSYRRSHGREQQDSEVFSSSGVSYWFVSTNAKGISRRVAKCGLRSIKRKTLIRYQKHWRQFHNWFHREPCNYSKITVDVIGKFLLCLFSNGSPSGLTLNGAALNTIRSSLSFFLQYDIPDLGYDTTITRLFKYFYLERPSFPRYVVTWDVGKVLDFLASWHPAKSLDMKQLTLKTVSLVALTSCDRAQTLHLLSVEQVHISAHGIEFVVPNILKTSKKGKPARVVSCVSWDDDRLNVCKYVHAYIDRTFKFRVRAVKRGYPKPSQLFLSHRTGRPVKRASISRWVRQVLSLAGIDASTFGPGSCRGASASAAARQGASAQQIMAAGSWSNLGTFSKFYNRPVEDTPVGRLILQEAAVS